MTNLILVLAQEWISKVHKQSEKCYTSKLKKENNWEGKRDFYSKQKTIKKNPNYYHQREECYENQQRHNGGEQQIQDPVC